MLETASPTEVFHRLVNAVAERRQSEIVDECYAEDVVVEHPFMIPEPTTTKGREQLRKRMTNLENCRSPWKSPMSWCTKRPTRK